MGYLDSGMSPGEANEKLMHHLSDFLREHFGDQVMLSKFVVLMETIQPDDRIMLGYVSPDMKVWESIGMLDWARDFEQSFYQASKKEGDDDQPD